MDNSTFEDCIQFFGKLLLEKSQEVDINLGSIEEISAFCSAKRQLEWKIKDQEQRFVSAGDDLSKIDRLSDPKQYEQISVRAKSWAEQLKKSKEEMKVFDTKYEVVKVIYDMQVQLKEGMENQECWRCHKKFFKNKDQFKNHMEQKLRKCKRCPFDNCSGREKCGRCGTKL